MSSKAGRIGKAALSPYNKAVPGVRGQCGVPFGPSRIHIANRWALLENYICKHFIKVGAEWASGESGLLPSLTSSDPSNYQASSSGMALRNGPAQLWP